MKSNEHNLPQVRARVERALALVGMQAYRDRQPYRLSMGEKKRIAIATVLAMDPDILAFDEPSAGLDPRARRGLIDLLRNLPLTMLVSTHDMLMVRELFDRMVISWTRGVSSQMATRLCCSPIRRCSKRTVWKRPDVSTKRGVCD